MKALVQCCESAPTNAAIRVSDEPFSQMVVLDYYDGPASGFIQCKACGAEYHFYLVDWDQLHNVRIFALAPLPEGSFERLFGVLGAIPDRPVWIPPLLSRASEEQLDELYANGLQEIIDQAATATLVIAWSARTERTLAMRGVDSSIAPKFVPLFEYEALSDAFDWFHYVQLVRSE